MKSVIWWIRRDLRLENNQALHAALQTKLPVIPLFILDPALLEDENDPLEQQDSRSREAERVEAEQARDAAARPDAWDVGSGLPQSMSDIAHDGRRDEQQQKADRAQVVFDIVPKNEQYPHIAQEMKPTAVHEHAGKQGNPKPNRVAEPARWRQGEIAHQPIQIQRAGRQLNKKHDRIRPQDQPSHQWEES